MTVVDVVRVPPSPFAAIVYRGVAGGHTPRSPVGSTLPMPGSIEALEAPVVDQASFAHLPCSIVAGSAEIETVGAAIAGGGAMTGAGFGASAFFGQRAFARAVASFALAIPSAVRHAK